MSKTTGFQWIDGEGLSVGDIGFLVETHNTNYQNTTSYGLYQRPSYGLYQRPCQTNQSHEPRLTGWCGETNNVSRHAQGLARVVKAAANGRVAIVAVTGQEGSDWLANVAGYPELIPDEWPVSGEEG